MIDLNNMPKLGFGLMRLPETEFVQIQLNYADWDNPVVRSGKLYDILRGRNIPMIIMEPVKGCTMGKTTIRLLSYKILCSSLHRGCVLVS